MKEKILSIVLEKENINCLLLAILFSAPMISSIIDIDNIIPTIIVGVILLLTIINRKTLLKKENFNIYIVIFLILFVFIAIFQFVFENRTQYFKERMEYFLVFGIMACVPLHIVIHSKSDGEIRTEKLVKNIILVYAIISPFIYFTNYWQYSVAERMAISYYMLPLYVSIIIEFFIEEKKSIKKCLIRYIVYLVIFLPYFNFFVVYLSRGAILAVAVAFILCLLQKRSLKGKIIVILIVLALTCIISFFALDILKGAQNILKTFQISFSFVDKNVKLLEEGKMGDGRDSIYRNAINDICEHPIIGNGIGYFKAAYGTYPHNFILQLWSEGGIIFLFIFLIPMLRITIYMIFDEKIKKEYVYLLIFLFCVSIIRLLLSYELWKDMFFWMYLYLALTLTQKKDEKRSRKHGKHNYTNI